MPKPAAEIKAQAPHIGGSMTFTGKMLAGAMGPGSPEMPTKGKQVCKAVADGFSYACDITSTAGTGKDAMTWKGHMVLGYDQASKTFKAFGADNMGGLMAMKGEMAGKKFTMTSVEPMTMMGMTFNDRVTWDLETMKFTDEHQMPGSTEWKVVEEDTLKPSGPPAAMAAAKKD
jgi:hypothetical protein